MKSQRLLKLFALLSLLATVAAAAVWYQTGQAPDPWLIRFAVAAFAAALVAGLIGNDTRPRLMLRFLAALFALVAIVAFAADTARQGAAGQGFSSMSLMDHLDAFAPSLLASAKTAISRTLGPGAWDPALITILKWPAFLIFGLLAAFCGYAGRPRRVAQIYVN